MPCSHPAPAPGPFLTAERFLFLPRPRGTQRGWGRGRIAPLLGALRGRGTAQGTPAPLPLPWRCRSAAEIQQHPHQWPGSEKTKRATGVKREGEGKGRAKLPQPWGDAHQGAGACPATDSTGRLIPELSLGSFSFELDSRHRGAPRDSRRCTRQGPGCTESRGHLPCDTAPR